MLCLKGQSGSLHSPNLMSVRQTGMRAGSYWCRKPQSSPFMHRFFSQYVHTVYAPPAHSTGCQQPAGVYMSQQQRGNKYDREGEKGFLLEAGKAHLSVVLFVVAQALPDVGVGRDVRHDLGALCITIQ